MEGAQENRNEPPKINNVISKMTAEDLNALGSYFQFQTTALSWVLHVAWNPYEGISKANACWQHYLMLLVKLHPGKAKHGMEEAANVQFQLLLGLHETCFME